MKDDTLWMVLASILAGILSTMNVWADSWSDVSFSMNDLYMIGMMTGWMYFFMGLFMRNSKHVAIGLVVALLFMAAIRSQFMIGQTQYLEGMIPHHSMAVMLSKRQLKRSNDDDIQTYLEKIITNQQEEIDYMKSVLKENSGILERNYPLVLLIIVTIGIVILAIKDTVYTIM